MCVALPGRVVERRGDRALVEVRGFRREVSILPLPDLREGEYVLISLGMAVERVSEEEARAMEALWGEVAAALEEGR